MRTTTDAKNGFNPFVSIGSKVLLFVFIAFCIFREKQAGEYFGLISHSLLQNSKWFLLLLATSLLFFLIYLCISRYGHIRLGKDNDKPEYSTTAWVSMVFSCGMGVGLLFWSVAEPITHYASNPFTKPFTDESASMAMQLSFFHWGLHPWAIYAIVAVALGYFCYRKDLPFSMRSLFYPLIGNKIYGRLGDLIDIIMILITAFGISQSLCIGVLELNTGLNHSFGINIDVKYQLLMVVVLCLLATLSLMSAISKGFKFIAEGNMVLSYVLVVAVMLIGATSYVMNTFFEGIGDYLQNLIGMSLWSDAQKDSGWQNWWTAYYWPWWMTWAPLVGMFIARISKGRTIRELICVSLFAPTLLTFFWLASFGGAALKIEKENHQPAVQVILAKSSTDNGSVAPVPLETKNAAEKNIHSMTIAQATKEDPARAVFVFFDHLTNNANLKFFLCTLLLVLLAIHCVTLVNAGTLVLCYMDENGSPNPSVHIRLTWGVIIPLISCGLIVAGGLKAIQTATIIAGFPIAVLLAVAAIALMKSLRREHQTWEMLPEHVRPDEFKKPLKQSLESQNEQVV